MSNRKPKIDKLLKELQTCPNCGGELQIRVDAYVYFKVGADERDSDELFDDRELICIGEGNGCGETSESCDKLKERFKLIDKVY